MNTEQLHCKHKQKKVCGDYCSQPRTGLNQSSVRPSSPFTTPHRRAEQIKHGVDGRHAGKKLEIKMEHKGMEDNVAHTRPKVAPSERI